MVKQLDDTFLIVDHVGVDLWRAALAWRERLHSEMVARGHAWYGDARVAVAAHVDPREGIAQSALAERMGMSKQGVQQLLDGLEADGIVRREPDPNDGRGKRVVYTEKGLVAVRDAVKVKRAIERDYKSRLGDRAFADLTSALRKLTPPPTT